MFNNFKGLTEIVFSLATSDENVLNYYGKYIHASRLDITAKDVHYLRSVIQKLLMHKKWKLLKKFSILFPHVRFLSVTLKSVFKGISTETPGSSCIPTCNSTFNFKD